MNDDNAQGLAPPREPAGELFRILIAGGKWVRMMGIIYAISVAMMALAGGTMLATDLMKDQLTSRVVGVLYLVLAPIYVLLFLPLLGAAKEAARLKLTPSLDGAVRAVAYQETFFRRMGIMMIVGLALVVVALIVGLIVVLAGRAPASAPGDLS